jgi:hypothetical protein
MTEKKPLEESERPQITPGAGEDAAAAAAKDALWGPQRMPSDYDLICEGEKVLQIRALPAAQSGLRIVRWARTLYRRSADWYRSWRAVSSGQSGYRIQLWMSENDSRILFWSLPQRLNMLLVDRIP